LAPPRALQRDSLQDILHNLVTGAITVFDVFPDIKDSKLPAVAAAAAAGADATRTPAVPTPEAGPSLCAGSPPADHAEVHGIALGGSAVLPEALAVLSPALSARAADCSRRGALNKAVITTLRRLYDTP
jgi:hypothetical protein